MRYYEITSGMRVPVSGEERALLSQVEDSGPVTRDSMDERQQEIARQMVTRGILLRSRQDGKVIFTPNNDPTLRRF